MLVYWAMGSFVYLSVWAKRWSVHVRLRNAVVAFWLITDFYIHIHDCVFLYNGANVVAGAPNLSSAD